QIADDVLDLVGEEEVAGKSLGTDLEQQKVTLPVLRPLKQAPREEKQRLCALLKEGVRSQLLAALKASDALAYATRRAEHHAANARQAVSCLPTSDCLPILDELTYQVVHRKR